MTPPGEKGENTTEMRADGPGGELERNVDRGRRGRRDGGMKAGKQGGFSLSLSLYIYIYI
jgi:hypothetical protein